MDRRTILKPEALDTKRLPLGAFEGFVLSQVDGQLTLEEIAHITNVDLAEAIRIANLLVNLGAASPVGERETKPRPRLVDARVEPSCSGRPNPRGSAQPRRIDPRAEPTSVRPDAERAASVRPARSSPAAAERAASVKPERPSSAKTAARAERRRSRRSLAMQQASAPSSPADEICELDQATVAAIRALEAKAQANDLYGLLEVERSAEKKQIKRAYFALAARYHPDRFFKKKLGSMRIVIERVFQRMTEAQDTLADPARRVAYDATLPPAPPFEPAPSPAVAAPPPAPSPAVAAPAAPAAPASPARKPTRPRLSSKALKASRPSSTAKKPSTKLALAKRPSAAKLRRAATPAPAARPITAPPARTPERREQLRNAAMEIKAQARIDLLVAAAEKALREHDPVTAETNYRLALQHREDPFLRDKLEGIEIAARIVRYEKHLGLGKAHEREQRWADAAKSFLRALDARPQAEAAARAANAIRLGGGDLEHAADLAETAVSLEPSNVAHRVVLVEILAAAGDLDDAREELSDLVAIAPKDERTKACASLLDRVRRRSE